MSSLLLVALLALTLFMSVSADALPASNRKIDAEVAAVIAEAFITDNVRMALGSVWTEDTAVANVVTMYDTDGQASAYSVELETDGQDSGYVVISAYADVENLILEYAEEAKPLYAVFGETDGENVIYTGLTGYFLENENGTYKTLDGAEIDETELGENVLQAARAPMYYAENCRMIAAVQNGRSLFAEVDGQVVYDPEGDFAQSAGSSASTYAAGNVAISDTIAHANQYYQGPFVTYSYRNDWENYATFRRTLNFQPTGEGNCGPTALTNFVEMFGARFNMSSITSNTYTQLYSYIRTLGLNNDWYLLGNDGGMPIPTIPAYFKAICDKYGIYYNAGSIINKTPTYDNIVYQLNNGGPFILCTIDHGYYKTHAVTAYGYIRLVSQTTGWYKSYVKICDGLASSGRFIDMSTIASSSTGVMTSWTW